MSLGNSPSGNTTTVQQSDPWGGVQPYLSKMFALANDRVDRQFGANNLAPQSGETNAAMSMQAQRATQGSPLIGAAQNSTLQTLRGDYLDPATNPAWNPTVQRLTDAYRMGTAAPLEAKFAKGGNAFMDNSAYQEMRAKNDRAFGDVLSGFAGQIYGDERERMVKSGLIAPSLAAQDYADIDKLGQVGAMKDTRAQAEVDQPWDTLTRFQRILSGQPGGSGSSTSPYFTNDLANAMGMGMMGLTIYDMLGNA